MKSAFQYFFFILIFGIALTATAQDQQSTGKVSMTTEKPIVNYGITNSPTGSTTAYGWGSIVGQFLSMPIPAGDPFTLIGPMTAGGFFSSADFGPDGTYYLIEQVNAELYTVDLATAATTLIGSTGVGLTGISYDWANDVFWGVSATELYTVDVTTGATTLVGPFGLGGGELMIDVAVDCNGNMYAYDLISDSFYSVDPATGTATLIGSLGYDANFGQGMSFDHSTGILYLSAFNNGTFTGQLRTVDVATGMTTLVFDWGFEQIAPFAIDTGCGPPCPVGDPSNPNPPDRAIDVPIDLPEIGWTNAPEAAEIELFFGPVGSVVSVYSGAPITSWALTTLNYSTTYSWKINGSDGNCTTFGPTWSFTTEQDPSIPFFDDFENGIGNWDITNDGGDCVWTPIELVTRPYTMPPDAMGWGMTADSDLCGSGRTLLSTATMNTSVDLSGYSTVWVEFDHDWRTIQTADEAYIEMSLDGGATWTEVESWIGVDDRENHVISAGSFTEYSSNIKFRLRVIQPGWDWWWAIDNFAVYGFTWGYLPPNAPSDLVAIANAPGQVLLNWQDNSDDEIRFDLQRKLGDSLSTNEYQWIGFTGENIITYIDTTVLDTTLYTYRVNAYKDLGGSSAFSNQAEILTIIPVELTSFEGNVVDGRVQLEWSTATETNNSGFSIERRQTSNVKRDMTWNEIGFVQGHGTTTEPQSYSFMDESILSGTYQYRLKQKDYDGSYEYSNIIEVEVGIPTEYSLEQNYPNPFNPTTRIRFSIPALETGHTPSVQLIIYDVLGNKVATLINEEKEAGIYEVEFNATNITSGIYFYRLTAGEYAATKKMIILK